ncbi:hypothetical protein AKJ16_DCAP11428 [Drosera capensis]
MFSNGVKMEKKLDGKEYMRTAMLKHEEIFRQQVYELHRLYQIQKILMSSYKAANSIRQNQERWIMMNRNGVHDQAKTREYIAESKGNEIHESEIELTLGPPICKRMKRRTQKSSFSGKSLSSSSTESSQIMMRSTPSRIQRRISGPGYIRASETDIGLGNEQDLNLKLPPWVLQRLTLKLT